MQSGNLKGKIEKIDPSLGTSGTIKIQLVKTITKLSRLTLIKTRHHLEAVSNRR